MFINSQSALIPPDLSYLPSPIAVPVTVAVEPFVPHCESSIAPPEETTTVPALGSPPDVGPGDIIIAAHVAEPPADISWVKVDFSFPVGSVKTQMIENYAITTIKLAHGSVTADKLSSSFTITGDMITDGTINTLE